MRDHIDDDAPGRLSASARYALWLDLVRGRVDEQQAAERHGLDVAAVHRIRHVAEQGALSALAASDRDGSAQVSGGDAGPSTAGRRVGDLLAASPVFFDVTAERRDELAHGSTLVILGRRTPIADGLAAGPLMVADGTLLRVDARDRPVDLVGAGVFRAPRAGRRLVALTDAQAVALPSTAADDVVALTRARIAAARPFGGARADERRRAQPQLATGVAADLVHAGNAQPRAPVADQAGHDASDRGGPSLPVTSPLLDVLHAMLEAGAPNAVIIDEDGSAVGSIDAADLPVGEDAGLASLLETLAHASSVEALRDVRNAARRLARGALAAGADVVEASRLLTAVSDRTVRVLLVIAHRELGPAPSDYAWLVFGSHARREQLPSSDQDTGLVYAAGLDRDGHDWFVTLGEWMTDALEACGYRRCPGGVMASRPDWRHDLAGWADMVRQWTDPSDSSRLVGADIGFDVRAVAGAGTLDPDGVDRRLARMIIHTTGNALTAARLARGAVARRPPSALWGRVGRNPLGPSLGERGRRIDLKRDAVQPIVDIARMHTLAREATEVPTGERLAAAAVDGVLSAGLAATLIEGHRLLTWTRLAAQLSDTPDADDRVGWAELPRPLRAQFSDTFGAIRAAQDALRTSHHLVAGS